MLMYNGTMGTGVSANTLLALAPMTIIPLGAAREYNSQVASCSIQLAYVCANVTAFP